MKQESYRRLVSGTNGKFRFAILRFLLRGPAAVYSGIIRFRNFLYSTGLLKSHRVQAVVISVGNITVGGTGKTPLVIWLCKYLKEKNIRCAILTRGYKTKKNESCDEPAVLARSCHDTAVAVNADRLAGAKEAIRKAGAEVLIMDDGFQHRRLKRDLDIVTIDSTEPFGYGRMLPAGLLREPLAGMKRASAAIITRCTLAEESKLAEIEIKLLEINPNIIIARTTHEPISARGADDVEIGIEELGKKTVFAFCGIGNPEAFFGTLANLKLNIAGTKVYDDHYRYTSDDIRDIYEEARYNDAEIILTTQKDWTKMVHRLPTEKDITFAYLAVELKFIRGEDEIRQLIESTLEVKITDK